MNSEVTVTHPLGVSAPWVPGLEHPGPGVGQCCGSAVQEFHGDLSDPNGQVTPGDPNSAAMYFQNGTSVVWSWNINSQAWVQTGG